MPVECSAESVVSDVLECSLMSPVPDVLGGGQSDDEEVQDHDWH